MRDGGSAPDVRVEHTPAGTIVQLIGEHDLATTELLASALEPLDGVTVNLTECTFLDSTILGVLVDHAKHRPESRVVIVSPTGTAPRRVLELTGFADLFETLDALPAPHRQ